ncbi:hypothetical protein KUTeg_003511 [Tegillarca granosa]|uniref:TTF-type domain-containing protein n=1 Tax=Tegillarca granosa TaxID=220873 RepID=A0ABQ9FRR9_TEGGR|nr:hypothetical protein KUTeg_003511 [Tegillarca granosa]
MEELHDRILKNNRQAVQIIKNEQENILSQRVNFCEFSNLTVDELATSLIPGDVETLPTDSVANKTTGNDNCFYNAASLFICGNESLNTCLRLLTASELFLNANNYTLDKRKVNSVLKRSPSHASTYIDLLLSEDTVSLYHMNKSLVECIENEALKTCVDKSWSEESSALKTQKPYVQDTQNISASDASCSTKITHLTSQVQGDKITKSDKGTTKYMSTSTKTLPQSTEWETPNIGDEPNQPKKEFPTKTIGKRKRSFVYNWFSTWPWLHYEENSDKVYCFLCVRAYQEHKLANLCKESAFISDGFNNWKKATNSFRDHESIRVLCPTRWTVKAEALYSVIQNYNILQDVWEEALDYVKEQEMRSRIRGVSLYMQTFEFLFGTILGETLLRNCDNLSKALQKERLSASEGNNLSSLTVRTLEKIRSEDNFSLFLEKVENKRHDLNVNEPKLPRKRILPKLLDDGAET